MSSELGAGLGLARYLLLVVGKACFKPDKNFTPLEKLIRSDRHTHSSSLFRYGA